MNTTRCIERQAVALRSATNFPVTLEEITREQALEIYKGVWREHTGMNKYFYFSTGEIHVRVQHPKTSKAKYHLMSKY